MSPGKDSEDDASLSQEDQVKRAADMREWLEARIVELETEVRKLREMLILVDSILRKTSFVPAAELRNFQSKKDYSTPQRTTKESPEALQRKSATTQTSEKKVLPSSVPPVESAEQTKELRRSKDGMLLANAFISPERISIVPTSDVKLSQTIPPFQSFFVNRILKGFESKDSELAGAGKIERSQSLSYQIEESDGLISKITINNYRDKARLNEILNTVSWAFSRMLEKK